MKRTLADIRKVVKAEAEKKTAYYKKYRKKGEWLDYKKHWQGKRRKEGTLFRAYGYISKTGKAEVLTVIYSKRSK